MTKEYVHLSRDERDRAAQMRAQGLSLREIGRQLGRDHTTIGREFRRNRSPVYDSYLPHRAQERSEQRWRASHERERLKNEWIRRFVTAKLTRGWSPELIAGRLREFTPEHAISHEAIYQYVYDPEHRKQEDLVPYLVRGHRKRRRRSTGRKNRKTLIPGRIPISERPALIETRREPGHWEADAAVSRKSTASLAVMVERTSRLPMIVKLNAKTSHEFRSGLTRRLSRVPKGMRRTITYDNGTENVEHEKVNDTLGTRSYFCNPYHSWEKGTVENRIGVIRRDLPKGTDFATVSGREIRHIEKKIQNRPMKCLSYRTPLEVFNSIKSRGALVT
jgi:transposase, IS30 family